MLHAGCFDCSCEHPVETIIAYGKRGLDDPTPVTADDHIRIGSNTKTWTGTVILQMVEEGKLALDDPVSKYRANVPNGENITIEMLLNMRSGLFNYSTTYKMNHILDTEPLRGWNQDDLLAIAFELPPYFEPNQGYRYSNTNTVLLGMIAEQIDGKQLETIFQDRIFAPLGLDEFVAPCNLLECHSRPTSAWLHVHRQRDHACNQCNPA